MPSRCLITHGIFTLFFSVLVWTVPADAGEHIVYTGQEGQLRPSPAWFGDFNFPPGQILAPSESSPSGNTVEVEGVGVVPPDYVGGGIAEYEATSANTVTISGGTVTLGVTGGVSRFNTSYGNYVGVFGGTVEGDVSGGVSFSDAAHANAVVVSGGLIQGPVYGGGSYGGAAYNNNVVLSGGTVEQYVMGGNAVSGQAYGNSVSVSGEASIASSVSGGQSSEEAAYDNTVAVSGGTVGGRIYGGMSYMKEVYGNEVVVSGGQVGGYIYGGYGSAAAAVYNNRVVVTAGAMERFVIGGANYSDGAVYNNTVVVSGGTVSGEVIGGYGHTGSVYGNAVVVSGGAVEDYVFGGVSYYETDVYGNGVVVSDGKVAGDVVGGHSGSGSAYGNTVAVSGGIVEGTVFGASSSKQAVFGNSVLASGGEIRTGVCGGNSYENDAYDNMIAVSGGEIAGPVIGGYSLGFSAYGNIVSVSAGTLQEIVIGGASNDDGAAYNNTVTLGGGTMKNHVFGGGTRYNDGTATGNTVTIAGAAELSAVDSMILGGADLIWHTTFEDGYVYGDLVSGNTLNFVDWSGSAKTFGNFETVNFVLSATAAAGDTIVTLAEAADFSNMALNQFAGNNPNNISTDISVDFIGGGKLLAAGERITLVNLVDNANHLDGAILSGVKGSLVEYAFKSVVDVNALVVEAQSVNANPRSKVLTQSYLASISLLNRGGDHVASQGISALTDAFLPDLPAGWSRLTAFGSVAGGHEKNKTGSHLSMDSITFLAGVGIKNQSAFGSVVIGAFFEGGYGDYDTTSSIANRASVHGDGDTRYLGGGLLGRLDLQNGLYVEASARIGRVKNKLDSSDLLDSISHAAASYDISDTYYGAHAGVGYLWNINQQSALDLYGKYFWTHTGGKSLFAANDPVRLDSVNSHRVRFGARYSYAATACVSPYVGAAFEYELDGKSKGSAYNVLRLPESKLKGATGLGEVGVSGRIGRATVDVGVQGYVGRRQGVNGVLRVGVAF